MIERGFFIMPSGKKPTRVHLIKNGFPLCGTIVGIGKVFRKGSSFRGKEFPDCQRCLKIGVERVLRNG